MRGQKPFIESSNIMESRLYKVIGGVTSVSCSISDVLSSLNIGAINIVNIPSIVAEQLQWSSKLDRINKDVSVLITGGLVMSRKRLYALPENHRNIIVETSAVLANKLTNSIEGLDDAAFLRMQGKMKVVTLVDSELSAWKTIYKMVRQSLANDTFSPELVATLEQLAN